MTSKELTGKLRNLGHRLTEAKLRSIEFICECREPFTAQDLISFLSKSGQKVNKTTAYRQLQTLVDQKVLQEIHFKDGVVRYELRRTHCHHHLVCRSCHKIIHVDLDNTLTKLQQQLSQQHNFQIQEHMLEFFGLCNECNQKELC